MRPVQLPAAAESGVIIVHVPAGQAMAMFRYCLEADGHGLAMATVIDPQRGIIKLLFSPHRKGELEELLESLRPVLGLEWHDRPRPVLGADAGMPGA